MIMKIKKYWKLLTLLFFVFLMLVICNSRLRMMNLPTGEYIESLNSPNNNYTLKSYRYSGGATVDWSVRVEVINNDTGEKNNIYWKYHEKDAKMKWLDEYNVEINDITLNIHKDYYYYN